MGRSLPDVTSAKQTVLVAYDELRPCASRARALEQAAQLVGRGGTVAVVNVIDVQSVSARPESNPSYERARG